PVGLSARAGVRQAGAGTPVACWLAGSGRPSVDGVASKGLAALLARHQQEAPVALSRSGQSFANLDLSRLNLTARLALNQGLNMRRGYDPETTADRPPASGGPRKLAPQLERPFRAWVFDWDGTAVVDRAEDAAPLARLVEDLLRQQVWIVVVTGTNFGNVDRQFCRLVLPRLRRHLLVCTNRGSEVYGFTGTGEPVRRWLREATPSEEQALTAVAEAVRDAIVARTGLDIRIVYDRLNRRKIDLIPLAEWADPPKARIGALLDAVEARLRGAGLAGGIREAVRLTEDFAAAYGLLDARITSDVKHIEVGLTDKGDSLAWIREHLLQAEHIEPRDVLIAGDEFGPVAGFPGSDDLLRAGIPDAVVVSVGAEPNGVPAGVLRLGGGPPQFRALLAEQLRLRGASAQPAARRRGVARATPSAARARQGAP